MCYRFPSSILLTPNAPGRAERGISVLAGGPTVDGSNRVELRCDRCMREPNLELPASEVDL